MPSRSWRRITSYRSPSMSRTAQDELAATADETCARSTDRRARSPQPHELELARGSLDGVDQDPRAGVVHVALWVPQGRLVLRLRRRRGVPGAHDDLVLSGREVHDDPPVPPRPAAQVVEQLGLRPPGAA